MNRLLQELLAQPEALRCTVEALTSDKSLIGIREFVSLWQPQTVVLTGMGSSLAAAYYGAYLLNQQGIRGFAVDTSELLYYGQRTLDQQVLLIVISQSGQSAEMSKLLDRLAHCVPIIGITNTVDSPLACRSTITLQLHAGPEYGASTKTFTCSLAALYLLVNSLCDSLHDGAASLYNLSKTMEQSLPRWGEQAEQVGQMWREIYSVICIGRGPAYSTAAAAEMLFQEVAKLPTHAITGGNFRHGPIEALSEKVGYLILESASPTIGLDHKLARELTTPNSPVHNKVVMVGKNEIEGVYPFPIACENERLQPLLGIVPVQLLALALATQRDVLSNNYRFGQKVTLHE